MRDDDPTTRSAFHDPTDRVITATPRAFAIPLVTSDRRIQDNGPVETIW